jgi:hypothetical protein
MLGTKELARRLTQLAIGRDSVREFEDWFVRESWNANAWAPRELRDAVYSLELVLSEYSNRHVSNSYVRAFAGDVARELSTSLRSIRPTQVGVRMVIADVVAARVAASPGLAAA